MDTAKPRYIKARELKLGDSIDVPGEWLHDDLAGLCCVLTVAELKRECQLTYIYDKRSESWTWFKDDEDVRLSGGKQ
jgi:hypothetical protein